MKEKEYSKPIFMDLELDELNEVNGGGIAIFPAAALAVYAVLVAGVYSVVGAGVLVAGGAAVAYVIGAVNNNFTE